MPRLADLVPPPLRPLARGARGFLRRWDRAPLDRVLDPADCQAVLVPGTTTFLLEQARTAACPVRAHNVGSAVWSSQGLHPIHLTLRWLSPRKELIDAPVARFALPGRVEPGQSAAVAATLTAPDALGHFLVEIDLAQHGGPAFRECGSKPVLVQAQVTGRGTDDIDYHQAYATADLTKDYWTVVGPGSREEFDRVGRGKLQALVEYGLTPDSRVLDVGCGTGQLAGPMEEYLGDRGFYYGTDIGPEAIAFCQARYRRPNFQFAQNEMTAVPVEGMAFDFVTFFSVFTHTYPDETALLLAEARRLLAPAGQVIGDVFTSPMVERCSGNRGAVELNREHFLRLVGLAGLKAEVVSSWPWQRYGRREVFRFTHPATG